MVLAADPPIISEIFAPIPAEVGFYATKPYPRKVSTTVMLNNLVDDLGITPYRLAFLLGLNRQTSVSRWLNGESNPSPYYLTIMLELRHLVHTKQLDLRIVQAIDWATGEITYKGQGRYDKSRNAVPPGKRALPDGGGGKRGAVSQFYLQSPG